LDNIGAMRQTRASMEAEATRLRNEGETDKHFVRRSNDKIIANAIRDGSSVSFLFGGNSPLSSDYFKGRHLQNLNTGISRLSANINFQVGALYRDSKNLQEEQIRIYREQSKIPSQENENENENDETENYSFDMRL